MKIYYDNIIYYLQTVGGISNYWTELIKGISLRNKITFYELKNKNLFRKNLYIKTLKEKLVFNKILRYLPFLEKLPPGSIFHSSYLRTTFQKDVANITTIHDFTYEYYGSGISKLVHTFQKKLSILNSDGIICVSNNTKKDLFKFYPNLEKQKVVTIYNGVSNNFFKIKNVKKKIKGRKFKDLSKKKIILFVGDRRKNYKNFFLAVDTVNALKDFVLVSVGGEKITNKEQDYINEKLKGKFHHFLRIDEKKLNIIYNISFCLLYPSLYEGFGLPIIEAMKAGCPVVSTNTSSIKEIAKDNAILINKVNQKNFVDAINSINDNSLRKKLIHKGLKQSKIFSWSNCSNETLRFYKKIHKKKFK